MIQRTKRRSWASAYIRKTYSLHPKDCHTIAAKAASGMIPEDRDGLEWLKESCDAWVTKHLKQRRV